MAAPELVRGTYRGVTLLGDPHCPSGVTLAFTERSGGVSEGGFSSLNLGSMCGDDTRAVEENRLRVLDAMGMRHLGGRLVCPRQVHGDGIVVVGHPGLTLPQAQAHAQQGADAVICLERDVPVLLCAADCALVVLVGNDVFAVVHSGWKGTFARIAGKTLRRMVEVSGCSAKDVVAYVGPHIGVADYEVSPELAKEFVGEFGEEVVSGERNLDLGAAIIASLVEEGMERSSVFCAPESTASNTDRFFSYRKADGVCGRHGALACMPTRVTSEEVALDQEEGKWHS